MGAGGITPPSPLTTTLYPQLASWSVDIARNDDVIVILLLCVSFMPPPHHAPTSSCPHLIMPPPHLWKLRKVFYCRDQVNKSRQGERFKLLLSFLHVCMETWGRIRDILVWGCHCVCGCESIKSSFIAVNTIVLSWVCISKPFLKGAQAWEFRLGASYII